MWSNISSRPGKSQLQLAAADSIIIKSEPIVVQQKEEPPSSPLMRYKHAVCSAPSGHIYVHGGRHANVPLDDDVWRFDPHQNAWSQLETRGPVRPPSLQEHTLVEHQDQLYLFGGQVSASNSEHSLWRLDLASLEWSSLSLVDNNRRRGGAHLGPASRRGHSAVVYQDSMYIYGGFVDFQGSSGQLWQFELASKRWELRNLSASSACHPEPRHSHSAIVHQDNMWIYGGLCNLKPLGDLWRWSWRHQRWFREKTRGASPGQLHGHTAVQAFGSMFVFGGERRGKPSRSLWRLNLANLVWQKVRPRGPRPAPTTWHAAVANPLSILDETNYIIEGEPDLKAALLAAKQGSLSEHCFSSHHQSPVSLQPADNLPRPQQVPLSHSKSSCSALVVSKTVAAELASNGSRPAAAAAKRRSRLSFLRLRSRGQTSRRPRSLIAGGAVELRQSASAGLLGTPARPLSLVDPPSQAGNPSKEEQSDNTRILDNLDTDIKQMFERALSPEWACREPGSMATSSSQLQTTSGTYVTARPGPPTTSGAHNHNHSHGQWRHSLAYTTPPSELATLASAGSTDRSRALLAAATPAERASGRRGDTRPKSEIVQSLIERADARIKHLYTPFFNGHHAHSGNSAANRYSVGYERPERPKRHTIPQTSTYYSLYFGEEQPTMPPQATLARDDLSSSTIKTIQFAGQRLGGVAASGGGHLPTGLGALVGVHGLTGSPAADSQKQPPPPPPASSEASLATSSESRTLCAQLDGGQQSANLTSNSVQKQVSSVDSYGLHSALTARRDTPTGEQSCDNTSLSFSIIAEFEEDDMLQYSSPVLGNAGRPVHRSEESDVELEPDEEYLAIGRTYRRITEQFLTSNEPAAAGQQPAPEVTNMELDVDQEKNPAALEEPAHKSASSGYDSISAGCELDSAGRHRKPGESADTESSLGGFTSETSPEQTAAGKHKRLRARLGDANCRRQDTTSSSVTAHSLALTSASRETASSSPLAKSLPASPAACHAHSQVACPQLPTEPKTSQRQPLRTKLFGKQKSKTRYWQLCMFVLGGKQGGSAGLNEPITVWRLYI